MPSCGDCIVLRAVVRCHKARLGSMTAPPCRAELVAVGVIFKISVLTGRDIGPYSFYPSESEILLSPNTKFAVSRALYTDELGYACVDLTEMRSTPMLAR